jgi:hypothetical protein
MSDLTPTRLDEIEGVARQATPGPWYADEQGCVVDSTGEFVATPYGDTDAQAEANTLHIAGLDPETVVELCRLARIGLTPIRQPLTTGRHAATPDIDYPYPCPACGAAGACSTLCPGDE